MPRADLHRFARRVAVALTCAVLAGWAWNSDPINLRDRVFPNHLAEVYPGWLYRSGAIAPNLVEPTLRRLQIGLIVDLTHEYGTDDSTAVAEREASKRLGIEQASFPLSGSGTGPVETYAAAVAAIARAEREGKHVLVHCRAGDRRTGGVIAAYELLVRHEPLARAYEELGRFNRATSLEDSEVVRYLHDNLPEIGAILQRQLAVNPG